MSEYEVSWIVVLTLVTLVGLMIALLKPIINLNKNLVQLSLATASLEREINRVQQAADRSELKNSEAHTRLWNHNEKQDEMLNDHENRIGRIEERYEDKH